MSEIVLTSQASPGALGANLTALFVDTSNRPSFVGSDGLSKALVDANNPTVVSNVTVVVGPVTMNVPSGRVNIAAGQNSIVVTNSLVTANSRVFAIPAANDTTGRVNSVEPAAGNFTVHCTAATANMPINFFLVN